MWGRIWRAALKCKVDERKGLGDERGRAEAEGEGVCEIKRKRKKRGRTDSTVPAARRFLWLTLLQPSHRAGKQKKQNHGELRHDRGKNTKTTAFFSGKKKQQTNKTFNPCSPQSDQGVRSLSCSDAELRLKTMYVDAEKEDVELVGVREETAEDEMEAGDWPWPTLKETRGKNCRNQFVSRDQSSLILLQNFTGFLNVFFKCHIC